MLMLTMTAELHIKSMCSDMLFNQSAAVVAGSPQERPGLRWRTMELQPQEEKRGTVWEEQLPSIQ